MSSIQNGQSVVAFRQATPICGNCKFEKRARNERQDKTERTCGKHGWYVFMSATCNSHQYRERNSNAVTNT
ncbi:hypothetical protein [Herminiimonas arsenitoxidans]|uniref:hypothetical protein n=1 Tax=Herminiimonas arsenitoxidans TaxID=1809410 RepID=UPI000970BA2A|nr:hypothetical protein [Herminiimonas arsenitoxidans]